MGKPINDNLSNKKTGVAIIVIAASLLFYGLSDVKLPGIDRRADAYFAAAIKKATLAYATVRGVNAVVSVLKESQVGITPAGVGVNLGVGQILDPIGDMTERLSSVLVVAIVSLGIQKMAMEIGNLISFKVIAALLVLLLVALGLGRKYAGAVALPVVKTIAVVFVLRLFLPLAGQINDVLYTTYLAAQIDHHKNQLAVVTTNYDKLTSVEMRHEDGWWSQIMGGARELKSNVTKIKQVFASIVAHLDEVIDALLMLTMLYVMVFLVQVILVPLTMLWIFLKIVDRLFGVHAVRRVFAFVPVEPAEPAGTRAAPTTN